MPARLTKQKQLLTSELGNCNSFFSADDLHEKVSKKNSKIGIATIYRFLKNLVREGNIHSYSCNRRTIYSTNFKNHSHFNCTQCKQTKHITIKKLDFLTKEVAGEICHFGIDVMGICDKCLRQQ